MFKKIKALAGGVSVLAVLLSVYLGYKHYDNVVKDLGREKQNVTALKNALDIEKATVRELRSNTGDWKAAQAELVNTLKEMQENSNDASLEAIHLQESFATGAPDSLAANAIFDRLWGAASAATRRRDNSGGQTDQNADAGAEAGNTDPGSVETD